METNLRRFILLYYKIAGPDVIRRRDCESRPVELDDQLPWKLTVTMSDADAPVESVTVNRNV